MAVCHSIIPNPSNRIVPSYFISYACRKKSPYSFPFLDSTLLFHPHVSTLLSAHRCTYVKANKSVSSFFSQMIFDSSYAYEYYVHMSRNISLEIRRNRISPGVVHNTAIIPQRMLLLYVTCRIDYAERSRNAMRGFSVSAHHCLSVRRAV